MIIVHVGKCDEVTMTCIKNNLSDRDDIVIINGDSTDDFDHGTMDNSDTSWTLSDMVNSIPYKLHDMDDYSLMFMQDINAINATEMMIRIARTYVCPPLRNHHIKPYRVNRMMFSKSGYLPKRIRRIRK